MSVFNFDPLRVVSEVVVIALVTLLLLLLWKNRERFMLALTGDTRIHRTTLDLLWWGVFRCCGVCTGDWTRSLTNCSCCPKRFRGTNLIKAVGQVSGFSSYTVELKNIVVGDLPFDGRGDFFLAVECSANPPMVTSLAEEKLPRVVHFPEVITLRIRDSPLEKRVKITVKDLNLLGSTEICSVQLSAMSVLDWSFEDLGASKRFAMTPCDLSGERETPPWILLEFSQPHEARDLDHFSENPSIVRTVTRDGRVKDSSTKDFKYEYGLLDTSGQPLAEPDEVDLAELANSRACVTWCFGCSHCMVIFLVVAYLLCRFYIWSCYRQYRWITIAILNNASFPISTHSLSSLVSKCDDLIKGTGIAPGVPCRPTAAEVIARCEAPPARQPSPVAFTNFIGELFDIEVQGVPCHREICKFRNKLVDWDEFAFISCAVLILSTCFYRVLAGMLIRYRKQHLNKFRAAARSQVINETHQKTVTRRGWLGF